jgi:pimeloyl-ACP methyl ester carboxylesterase
MQLEIITKKPDSTSRPTPLLFVHGMWHAAWCWVEHFLPYFAQHGYMSHAVSLRGHGASEGRERLRWTSLAEYVADVAQVTSRFEKPLVLIGHSMGGMIVQKHLESHQAPAAVLLGSIPPNGLLGATLRFTRRHPLLFLKANLTMSLIHVVSTPALVRESLFSADLPQEKVETYAARLQDESYRAYIDALVLNLPRPKRVNTPVLVLGASEDFFFPPGEVKRTGRDYHTQAEIFPNMAHDMMLEPGWQAVADRILGWLDDRGL